MGLREQQQKKHEVALLQGGQVVTVEKTAVTASMQAVLIALRQDVEVIRNLTSLSDKNRKKTEYFLPKWLPFVDEHFSNGKREQNDVIAYCIIYLVDTEQFTKAIELAEKAIANGQKLPANFKTAGISQFVAQAMLEWAEREYCNGRSVQPYFGQILDKVVKEWQINEITFALIIKRAAFLLLKSNKGTPHAASVNEPIRLIRAIQLLTFAFKLNHKIGVKTLIERCHMRLNAILEHLREQKLNVEYLERLHKGALELENIKGLSYDLDEVIKLLNSPFLSINEVIKKEKEREIV